MGEGGCVLTSRAPLRKLVESFRDWGRDCWCEPGVDNTCGKRFGWQLGELPHGFDHKYTYSHIGYNLKPTDIQAAIGLAQLSKLDGFITVRKENFRYLRAGLADLTNVLVLPEATADSDPSWFGFAVCVRPDCGISRQELVKYLEEHQIATRLLFGGNLVRQPAYKDVKFRTVGDLNQSDQVMNQVFWVGLYPGLKRQALDYTIEVFHNAVKELRH
jgi:CDP-6-deoxy-D-xylo-4-hexulose-3-dehydrase